MPVRVSLVASRSKFGNNQVGLQHNSSFSDCEPGWWSDPKIVEKLNELFELRYQYDIVLHMKHFEKGAWEVVIHEKWFMKWNLHKTKI